MADTQNARSLLDDGAFEQAARQAWIDVRQLHKLQSAIVGAAAYLWMGDLDNFRSMMDLLPPDDLAGHRALMEELNSLSQTGEASGDLAPALLRMFLVDPSLGRFALAHLQKGGEHHRWRFFPSIDWRLIPLSGARLSNFISGVLEVNLEAGATIMAQCLRSSAAGLRAYLPPQRFMYDYQLSMWREALLREEAPREALLTSIVEHALFVRDLIYSHVEPSQEGVELAQTLIESISDEYPTLAATLRIGLGKKCEKLLPFADIIEMYRLGLEKLDRYDGTYLWLRQQALLRARHATGQPTDTGDYIDAGNLKLLLMACVAIRERIAGVILTEVLRREFPDRPASVLAGWLFLCFGAPKWSIPAFDDLGYVAPEFASAFPALPGWPNVAPPSGLIQEWRARQSAWPRISVVIPSYEQGEFIEATILSLLNQGYPDLEIFVEDGGSQDDTLDVLARYRDRLTHIRSGPDEGQSDALSQGLNRATGDILSWLNSDDMLAPFALYNVAEAFLAGGEVLAGACFEFKDDSFIQINLPSLEEGPLKQRGMADLRNKWFMGHYFYQPEVFFSAEAYRRAGGYIDKKLHYTMDYDLWMRLGGADAQVAKVKWPVALFRRHEKQKTFNLDRTVIEQGDVRRKYVSVTPEHRIASARRRLAAAFRKPKVKILVVTGKLGRFFPLSFPKEIAKAFKDSDLQITFVAAEPLSPVSGFDIILLLNTLTPEELEFVRRARSTEPAVLLVGWFWDNHHLFRDNLEFADILDIGIAGHDFASAYLASPRMWLLPSVLLSYTQWSEQTIANLKRYQALGDRSNELYGGFVSYPDAPERSIAIKTLQDSGYFPELKLIDSQKLGGYYKLTEADRFVDWCSYKASLCANIERDVPIRYFDALVTGQIPILPRSAIDEPLLRATFPEDQFVTCDSLSPDDVRKALARAIDIFDEEGSEGALRRSERAVRVHNFMARLASVVDVLKEAARG
ncbi:hypothetical protein BH10PSE2_BH10PSE2_07620 [soil metagenome]